MTDSPISCPICFAHWDFKTDFIGRLIAVHPITKCVPRVEGRYVECSVCEKEIELLPEASQTDRRKVYWCSEECHEVLREKRRAAARLAAKRQWVRDSRLDRIWRKSA
jgi:predicted nucleic acid-binding Zn ribbon protein